MLLLGFSNKERKMINEKHKTLFAETNCATIEVCEEGIVFVRIKNKSEIELEESKRMQSKTLELTNGKKFVALVDGRAEVVVSKESREWGSTKEAHTNLVAQAIVVNSLANRMVGNFIIKFHKPHAKTRLFSDEESALVWLREQKRIAGI